MQIIDSGGSISVAYVIPDTTLMNESSWYVFCVDPSDGTTYCE